jgi:hypothetical protein
VTDRRGLAHKALVTHTLRSATLLLLFTLFAMLGGCADDALLASTPDAQPVDVLDEPDAPTPSDASAVDGAVTTFRDAAPDTPSSDDVPGDLPAAMPPRCSVAVQRSITLPTDRLVGRTEESDADLDLVSGCRGWSGHGPASLYTDPRTHVYALHIPRRVGVRLRSTQGRWFVGVRQRCDDARSTVLCDLLGTELRAVLEAGHYFVVLSAAGNTRTAPYDVAFETFELAPNAWCETATELTPEAPVHAENIAAGAGLASSCASLTDPQRYFAITIPAQHRAFVDVVSHRQENPVPAWAPWRPLLRAFANCAPATCLGAAPMHLILDNHERAPRRVIVSVGSSQSPIFGTGVADLALRFAPLEALAVEAACAAAIPVTDGDVLPDQRTERGLELPACSRGSVHRARFYTAIVPAGAMLTAAVNFPSGATPANFAIQIVGACAELACLPYSYPNTPVLRWTNSSTETRRIVFVIGGSQGTEPLTYSLRVAIRQPPPHTSCTTALTLRGGEHRMLDDIGGGGSGSSSCYTGRSQSLYYRVVVPPRRRLTATLTPIAEAWFLHVGFLTSCAPTMCVGQRESRFGETLASDYINDSDAEREVVLVATASPAGGTIVDVALALSPLGT